MPGKPIFVVMSIVLKRGRVAPGTKDVAPSSSGAVKRAEAQAARNAGTAALRIVADDESGEVKEAEVLAFLAGGGRPPWGRSGVGERQALG